MLQSKSHFSPVAVGVLALVLSNLLQITHAVGSPNSSTGGTENKDDSKTLDLSGVTSGISDFFRDNMTIVIAVGSTIGAIFVFCLFLCVIYMLRMCCCPPKVQMELVLPEKNASSSDAEEELQSLIPSAKSKQRSSTVKDTGGHMELQSRKMVARV